MEFLPILSKLLLFHFFPASSDIKHNFIEIKILSLVPTVRSVRKLFHTKFTRVNSFVIKLVMMYNIMRIENSFIKFELAKWNEKAKEEILACKNLKEPEKLFDVLYEKYF